MGLYIAREVGSMDNQIREVTIIPITTSRLDIMMKKMDREESLPCTLVLNDYNI